MELRLRKSKLQILLVKNLLLNSKEEILKEINLVFKVLNSELFKTLNNNPNLVFNYELFNRNNFNIHYWSWNYRGCWHQTCPPIVSLKTIYRLIISIGKQKSSLEICCHYLSTFGILLELGNLRACCLPWKW